MHKQDRNGEMANQEEVFECVNRTRRLLIDGALSIVIVARRTMNHRRTQAARSSRLPVMLRALFWAYDFAALTWGNDRDLIMTRALTA